MTDTRTNEEIVAEALPNHHPGESYLVTAALAAAGRLVTPEHDAQVIRDAAAEAPRLPMSTAGQVLVGAWLHERADDIEKDATS